MEDSQNNITKSLHKIIDKFILPKFPWVTDYRIRVVHENGRDWVLVIYYPKTDEDNNDLSSFTIEPEFRDIEDLTATVFKMMGFNTNTKFEGVRFETK